MNLFAMHLKAKYLSQMFSYGGVTASCLAGPVLGVFFAVCFLFQVTGW